MWTPSFDPFSSLHYLNFGQKLLMRTFPEVTKHPHVLFPSPHGLCSVLILSVVRKSCEGSNIEATSSMYLRYMY